MSEKKSSVVYNGSPFHHTIRVGWFLAFRQIKRASVWTNILIIFIMTLTFLNLVVVSGILVGLIEGASRTYRTEYSGEVLITNLPTKAYIEDSQRILRILDGLPGVVMYTPRYISGGSVEANYKRVLEPGEVPDQAAAPIAGIYPQQEDSFTNLSSSIFRGEYLDSDDHEGVLVGKFLLKEFLPTATGFDSLDDVKVGDKLRITIEGRQREMIVRGILDSKIESVSLRIFMNANELHKMLGRPNLDYDEIAIKLEPGVAPEQIRDDLLASGVGQEALVQTWEESQGKFFKDLAKTFNLLGAVIGSIGLAVASITIFIVIFINAISRKKYIGILKGIGITSQSIEMAYVVQSLVYAAIGTIVGLLLLYLLFIPYIEKNPIDFTFSDGVLVAPILDTMLRAALLMVTTLIAGYVPAKIVTKGNTLDAILGR